MTTNAGESEKRKQSYASIYLGFSRQLNIDEYKNNPALIKMLSENNEIAMRYIYDIENLLYDANNRCQNLEIQKKEFEMKFGEASHRIETLEKEKKLIDSELSRIKTALENLKYQKSSTDIKLATITKDIESAKELSLMQALASTVATVLIGFGTGLITAGLNYGLISESLLVIGIIFNLFPTIMAYIKVGKRK